MQKSIALIFHENEWKYTLRRFAIWHLADIWRRENIKVILLFGVRKFVPADVAFLHVDLSLVPESYIDFARRYPVIVNGRIRDIRKSRYSEQKVNPDDGYKGPVIVKSALNYAGQPERKLLGTAFSRLALRITSRLPSHGSKKKSSRLRFRSPRDYQIYEKSSDVPQGLCDRVDFVAQVKTNI